MTDDPLVPVAQLAPLDEELVRRTRALSDLALDIDRDPAGIALARSEMFARWPELVPGGPLDPQRMFYNRYFWFRRFVTLWQAEHGENAGLEQQALQLLEYVNVEVDWDIVGQLHERAQDV